MKKAYLFITAIFISLCSLDAQVVFLEDFDGIPGPTAGGAGTYAFPSGWFLRNVDNRTPDANVAYVNEAWERREDFNFSVVDSCAFSTSWYAPAGAADDWMWTPLIGPLPGNSVLSWNAVTYDASFPDGYEVRIMTSASGPPTGGTGVLGNQVSASTQLFTIAAENTAWTSRSVNLNAYAGQSVYIGFRNTSNDKFLLLIDDVKVEVQVNYDAAITSVTPWSEYTQIPIDHATTLPLQATVTNNGLNPVTNTTLSVNVFDQANALVHTAAANMGTIAAGGSLVFNLPGFTPTYVSDYHAEFAVTITETDQVATNDTATGATTAITDSTYARDDATVTGALGIGAGVVGFVGQQFDVVTADQLTSVSWFATLGYTGRQMAAVVWDMAAGVPNQVVASTDTMLYPDDSARFYTLQMSGGPVSLAPGMYAVTMVEFDSTIQVGQTNTIFTNGTTWVNWPGSPFGTWANNEDFGAQFAKSYVIRPNFADVCLGFTATSTTTDATCGACPDGSATVSVSAGNAPFTYAWSTGGTGTTENGLTPGSYTVTVTDQYGCTTTDTITILNTCTSFDVYVDTVTHASCSGCNDGNVTIATNNGTGPFTWAWSTGDSTAMIDSLVPGTYFVTVTDSFGCIDTISVVISFGTGIDAFGAGTVGLFPNPSEGAFTLSVNLATPSDMEVEIYNALGQRVIQQRYSGFTQGMLPFTIDAPGAYTVKVITGSTVKAINVMVR